VLFLVRLQLVQKQQLDELCLGQQGRQPNLQDQFYNLHVMVLVMMYGTNVVNARPYQLLHQTAVLQHQRIVLHQLDGLHWVTLCWVALQHWVQIHMVWL
jgi:hypothetical protein